LFEGLFKEGGMMSSRQYCAYNLTRECFLGLHVTAADLQSAKLGEVFATLALRADEGLWLKPFRGIPNNETRVAHDLVFLDRDLRVLGGVEWFPVLQGDLVRPQAASVLVLSSNSIYSSNTQPGDQLVLCAAEEMCRNLERGSSALRAESARQSRAALAPPEAGLMKASSAVSEAAEPWHMNWPAQDRRRATREPAEGLAAFFWYGSTPEMRAIRDISATGLYLITAERWYPGTLVQVALQSKEGEAADRTVAVQSCVMRWGKDGVGLQFVLSGNNDRQPGHESANPQQIRELLQLLQQNNG
jgi:hypothetical protein